MDATCQTKCGAKAAATARCDPPSLKVVLKGKASRKAFPSDPSHRIRFAYTPRHCSWLNQIEIWFGILSRKLLRRSSFASAEELKQRVLAFIEYFNRTMARPIRWLYSPRPLMDSPTTG